MLSGCSAEVGDRPRGAAAARTDQAGRPPPRPPEAGRMETQPQTQVHAAWAGGSGGERDAHQGDPWAQRCQGAGWGSRRQVRVDSGWLSWVSMETPGKGMLPPWSWAEGSRRPGDTHPGTCPRESSFRPEHPRLCRGQKKPLCNEGVVKN